MGDEDRHGGEVHHVMVDTETLGTVPGSSILTLGAISFNPRGKPNPKLLESELTGGSVFYERIDRQSCLDVGLAEDAETVAWWQGEKEAARHEVFGAEPRRHIGAVLEDFCKWFGRKGRTCVWSHGLTFDVPLLEAALRQCGMKPPWRYYDALDTRTMYWHAGLSHRDVTTPTVKHHALYDAAAKAFDMQLCVDQFRAAHGQ